MKKNDQKYLEKSSLAPGAPAAPPAASESEDNAEPMTLRWCCEPAARRRSAWDVRPEDPPTVVVILVVVSLLRIKGYPIDKSVN